MKFVLDPMAPAPKQVRRLAKERLDRALAELAELETKDPAEVERAVHQVRKRCKEARALARLARTAVAPHYREFNRSVRDAADELASIRDAHALLATLDDLRASQNAHGAGIAAVREAQAATARAATQRIHGGDPSIGNAIRLLSSARKNVSSWHIPKDTGWLEAGLTATYAAGRAGHREVRNRQTDQRMHDWRKEVKRLWYQVRLVEASAPSVLGPLVGQLDDLAEALGDDHDLAVLVERIESSPKRFGGKKPAKQAIKLARRQQRDLRHRAIRLGASLYAESPSAFGARLMSYWSATKRLGPEMATGGIAELLADEARTHTAISPLAPPKESIERERTFLVTNEPRLDDRGTRFRQGYLAIDGTVSVRVRDASGDGCTVTIKAGRGAIRTELEWQLTAEQFEQSWKYTADRRVHKTRYRIDLGGGTIAELDEFHDDLAGLMLVEVEFQSDEQMLAFEPPDWFGTEVTENPGYSNAVLAVRGRP